MTTTTDLRRGPTSTVRSLGSFLLGSPRDWHLRRPTMPRLGPIGLRLVGPLAVLASLVVSWPAFSGATGEDGNVAIGLWVGAVSILLMAWSFILAMRPRVLEPIFGGLDSMYRVHRWAGAAAVAFMFLHTSIEPEIEGGILGAGRGLADSAEDLAGVGEIMLYVLIGLSVIRLFPYRLWRLTHKLLGLPFVFACFHFFTAEKPYGNGSPWGWWFGTWMVAGVAAFLGRVVWQDIVARGHRYRVTEAEHQGSTTRLRLEPLGRPLGQRTGQFAFVKLQIPGMSEPHPFTIASDPDRPELEFYIRHLGDWSQRLPQTELVGRRVRVEGPYGRFEPIADDDRQTVWIAGGVGITPFLAALDRTVPAAGPVPTLLYAVRDPEDNPIVERLRAAERDGVVTLHLFTPDTGRLGPDDLDRLFPDGLTGAHVALCGPAGLVASMAAAATARGARQVETEDFDIRQGFGPERSSRLAALWAGLSSSMPILTGATRLSTKLQQRLFDTADVVAAGADGVGDQRSELVQR